MDRRSPARKTAGLLFTSLAFCSAVAIAAPGDPLGPPQTVNVVQSDQQVPEALTADNAGFRAYWTSSDSGMANGYLRRFNSSGTPLSGDLPLFLQGTVDVAAAPDGRHVAVHVGFAGSRLAVLGQRYDAAGIPVGPSFEVTDPASAITDARLLGFRPRVAMNAAGQFVVAWSQGKVTGKAGPLCSNGFGSPRNCLGTLQTKVMARRFATDGTPAAPVTVDSVTSLDLFIIDQGGTFGFQIDDPAVALAADGGFAVTWMNDTEATTYLRSYQSKLRYFPPSGNAPLARVVEFLTAIESPEVAFDGIGNIIVAYQKFRSGGAGDVGTWVRRYATSSSNALGPAVRVDAGTTPGQSAGVALAANGSGGFAVAWAQQYEGIRLQRYGANGAALGGNVQVSTEGDRFQGLRVAAAGGRMMLVWAAVPPSLPFGTDVYGRVYEGP